MFSLQINNITYLLAVLLLLGVFSQNSAVTVSAAVLLVVQQTALSRYLPLLEQYGLKIGIIVLTIGVLSPLVSGRAVLPEWKQLLDWKMLAAVATGILVAYLGGRGVSLMSARPTLITGLLLGTLAGVALFKGVPVGPLIAAGILSLLLGKN